MKRSLTAGIALLALAACKDGGTGSDDVSTVLITPAAPSLPAGATVQLSAVVIDEDGNDSSRPVQWQSLSSGVATVSNSGLVTGVANGQAEVVARAGSAADTVIVSVGGAAMLSINTNAESGCSEPQIARARVAATSQHAIILTDMANPPGDFSDAEYAELAQTFDNLVWPSDVENFGAPTDIDRNGRVYILFTRAVNELTPAGSVSVVGGFFYSRDLFPRRETAGLPACAASNQAEIFYMLAPDPNGVVNGNPRSRNYVRTSSLATVAHEFQHLINNGRRLHVNKLTSIPGEEDIWETVWLDEGLAHIAEELAFYRATGLQPGQNLTFAQTAATGNANRTSYFQYQDQNSGRIETYLRNPETQSLFDPYVANSGDGDDLETRGAIWAFLRYAADRKGGNQQQTWLALANSNTKGIKNLNAVFGTDVMPWIRDWHASMYVDDAVAGAEARFTTPSWNYRSVLAGLTGGHYPLRTRVLTSGQQTTLSLKAGSGAYLRFGVAPGIRAELRTTSGGAVPGGTCGTTLNLAVGQSFQTTGDQAAVLCVNGGAAGGEYTMIPFFGGAAGSLAVEVVPAGVVPVVGPPNPSLAPWQETIAAAAPRETFGVENLPEGDGGFHMRLRHREREEMNALLGFRGPSRSVSAAPAIAPAALQVTIVRTR